MFRGALAPLSTRCLRPWLLPCWQLRYIREIQYSNLTLLLLQVVLTAALTRTINNFCSFYVLIILICYNNNAIRVAVGLGLGTLLCEAHTCPCGAIVYTLGRHALSCKRHIGRSQRHAFINDVVWHGLNRADIPAMKEPLIWRGTTQNVRLGWPSYLGGLAAASPGTSRSSTHSPRPTLHSLPLSPPARRRPQL